MALFSNPAEKRPKCPDFFFFILPKVFLNYDFLGNLFIHFYKTNLDPFTTAKFFFIVMLTQV